MFYYSVKTQYNFSLFNKLYCSVDTDLYQIHVVAPAILKPITMYYRIHQFYNLPGARNVLLLLYRHNILYFNRIYNLLYVLIYTSEGLEPL